MRSRASKHIRGGFTDGATCSARTVASTDPCIVHDGNLLRIEQHHFGANRPHNVSSNLHEDETEKDCLRLVILLLVESAARTEGWLFSLREHLNNRSDVDVQPLISGQVWRLVH